MTVSRLGAFSAALAVFVATALAGAAEPPAPAPAAAKTAEPEEPEVTIIDLTEEPEPDHQAYAAGMSAGPALIVTKGSPSPTFGGNFVFTFSFGLGPGGARIPWSIDAFASFTATRSSFKADIQAYPDRWTEIGARLVYRGESGFFAERFLALGLGGAWTSYGRCSKPEDLDAKGNCTNKGIVAPGLLLAPALGLQEWTSRTSRYGLELAVPVEISSHSGFAVFARFYAQLGLRR